jgi:uncharacterized protein (TIGR03435 family)
MRFLFSLVVLLAFCDIHAQTPTAALRFEVASIKPSAPTIDGMYLRPQPGGLRIEGATLKNLIAIAFDVREFTISGGPGWIGSDRFDIDARAESGPSGKPGQADQTKRQISGQQIRECLQSLLADRFELAIHRETKEDKVYPLVLGANGPRFSEGKPDSKPMIRGRKGLITGQAVPMQMLALNLANSLSRTVLDRTGLNGKYDFKLEWTPEALQGAASPAPANSELPVARDPDGPYIFAALQEQLGLRLETQKAPVATLLIDRVARPSAN